MSYFKLEKNNWRSFPQPSPLSEPQFTNSFGGKQIYSLSLGRSEYLQKLSLPSGMLPTVLANMKKIDISVILIISSYSPTIIGVIIKFSDITSRRMSLSYGNEETENAYLYSSSCSLIRVSLLSAFISITRFVILPICITLIITQNASGQCLHF